VPHRLSGGSLLGREHPAFQFISEDPLASMAKAHTFDLLNMKLLRLASRTADQAERGDGRKGKDLDQPSAAGQSCGQFLQPVFCSCKQEEGPH